MLEQIKKFLASIPEIIETFLDSSAFASLGGVTSLHTNCCVHATRPSCVHATPPKVTLGGEIYGNDKVTTMEEVDIAESMEIFNLDRDDCKKESSWFL
jgi:hypothetical protein